MGYGNMRIRVRLAACWLRLAFGLSIDVIVTLLFTVLQFFTILVLKCELDARVEKQLTRESRDDRRWVGLLPIGTRYSLRY